MKNKDICNSNLSCLIKNTNLIINNIDKTINNIEVNNQATSIKKYYLSSDKFKKSLFDLNYNYLKEIFIMSKLDINILNKKKFNEDNYLNDIISKNKLQLENNASLCKIYQFLNQLNIDTNYKCLNQINNYNAFNIKNYNDIKLKLNLKQDIDTDNSFIINIHKYYCKKLNKFKKKSLYKKIDNENLKNNNLLENEQIYLLNICKVFSIYKENKSKFSLDKSNYICTKYIKNKLNYLYCENNYINIIYKEIIIKFIRSNSLVNGEYTVKEFENIKGNISINIDYIILKDILQQLNKTSYFNLIFSYFNNIDNINKDMQLEDSNYKSLKKYLEKYINNRNYNLNFNVLDLFLYLLRKISFMYLIKEVDQYKKNNKRSYTTCNKVFNKVYNGIKLKLNNIYKNNNSNNIKLLKFLNLKNENEKFNIFKKSSFKLINNSSVNVCFKNEQKNKNDKLYDNKIYITSKYPKSNNNFNKCNSVSYLINNKYSNVNVKTCKAYSNKSKSCLTHIYKKKCNNNYYNKLHISNKNVINSLFNTDKKFINAYNNNIYKKKKNVLKRLINISSYKKLDKYLLKSNIKKLSKKKHKIYNIKESSLINNINKNNKDNIYNNIKLYKKKNLNNSLFDNKVSLNNIITNTYQNKFNESKNNSLKNVKTLYINLAKSLYLIKLIYKRNNYLLNFLDYELNKDCLNLSKPNKKNIRIRNVYKNYNIANLKNNTLMFFNYYNKLFIEKDDYKFFYNNASVYNIKNYNALNVNKFFRFFNYESNFTKPNKHRSNTNKSNEIHKLKYDNISYSYFLFYPDSKFIKLWHIILCSCVVYNLIALPLLFLNQRFYLSKIILSKFEILDMFIDKVFFIDILINFRTGYKDSYNNIILDTTKIKYKYIKSNKFYLDIISSFPFEIFTLNKDKGMINFLKFPRTFHITKVLNQYNKNISYMHSIYAFNLINMIMLFLIFVHWISCFIYYFVFKSLNKKSLIIKDNIQEINANYHTLLFFMSDYEISNCFYKDKLGVNDISIVCKYSVGILHGLEAIIGENIKYKNLISLGDNILNKTLILIILCFTYIVGSCVYSIIFGYISVLIEFMYNYSYTINKEINYVISSFKKNIINNKIKNCLSILNNYFVFKNRIKCNLSMYIYLNLIKTTQYCKNSTSNGLMLNRFLKQKLLLITNFKLYYKLPALLKISIDDSITAKLISLIKKKLSLPSEILAIENCVSEGLFIFINGNFKVTLISEIDDAIINKKNNYKLSKLIDKNNKILESNIVKLNNNCFNKIKDIKNLMLINNIQNKKKYIKCNTNKKLISKCVLKKNKLINIISFNIKTKFSNKLNYNEFKNISKTRSYINKYNTIISNKLGNTFLTNINNTDNVKKHRKSLICNRNIKNYLKKKFSIICLKKSRINIDFLINKQKSSYKCFYSPNKLSIENKSNLNYNYYYNLNILNCIDNNCWANKSLNLNLKSHNTRLLNENICLKNASKHNKKYLKLYEAKNLLLKINNNGLSKSYYGMLSLFIKTGRNWATCISTSYSEVCFISFNDIINFLKQNKNISYDLFKDTTKSVNKINLLKNEFIINNLEKQSYISKKYYESLQIDSKDAVYIFNNLDYKLFKKIKNYDKIYNNKLFIDNIWREDLFLRDFNIYAAKKYKNYYCQNKEYNTISKVTDRFKKFNIKISNSKNNPFIKFI